MKNYLKSFVSSIVLCIITISCKTSNNDHTDFWCLDDPIEGVNPNYSKLLMYFGVGALQVENMNYAEEYIQRFCERRISQRDRALHVLAFPDSGVYREMLFALWLEFGLKAPHKPWNSRDDLLVAAALALVMLPEHPDWHALLGFLHSYDGTSGVDSAVLLTLIALTEYNDAIDYSIIYEGGFAHGDRSDYIQKLKDNVQAANHELGAMATGIEERLMSCALNLSSGNRDMAVAEFANIPQSTWEGLPSDKNRDVILIQLEILAFMFKRHELQSIGPDWLKTLFRGYLAIEINSSPRYEEWLNDGHYVFAMSELTDFANQKRNGVPRVYPMRTGRHFADIDSEFKKFLDERMPSRGN